MKKNEVKALKIKNGHLQTLYKILNVPIHGKEARSRNRFIQLIAPRFQEMEKYRLELLNKYADKDKDKKPIVENDVFKITPDNMKKYQSEYTEYLNDFLIIDILPSNRIEIGLVKEILENSKVDLAIEEGVIYDILCTNFEEAI